MVCRVGLSVLLSQRCATCTFVIVRDTVTMYLRYFSNIAIVLERCTTTAITLFRASIELPAPLGRYTSIDYTTITRNRGSCNNITFASVFT